MSARAMLHAAAVVAGLAIAPASAADAPADPVVETLKTVCTSTGFTLEQRIAALDDWAIADPVTRAKLKGALIDGAFAIDRLLRGPGEGGGIDFAGLFAQRLDSRLADALDARRGAARLLVNQSDATLGLLLDAVPGRFPVLACKAVFLAPSQDLIDDLTQRFSLLPVEQDAEARVWTMRTATRGETADIDHGRSLTLLMDGANVRTAVLEFLMTVRPR